MFTEKMITTKNWEERNQAEELGIDLPQRQIVKTKMLFWKTDVRRAFVNEEGVIVIVMKDDMYFEMDYEEKMWKELQAYFKEKESEK